MKRVQRSKQVFKMFLMITFMMAFNYETQSQNMVFLSGTTSAQQLVDTLLGGGVVATNVSYAGSAQSKGVFYDGATIGFPIDKGILLCTGSYTSVPGVNSSGMTSDAASGNADSDLQALITASSTYTNDACVLEFDFVAASDSIQFEYIFASEEYPEFACGGFNDIFAFFLSGQNPAGGNYVKKNIALVPGTNTVVSVNTVNAGVFGSMGAAANCSSIDPNWASYNVYYNDNPRSAPTMKIKPDGYTDIFTAKAAVVSGQTYHIKLAIADVGYYDNGYDSYVFIKAKSFKAPGMGVTIAANPTSVCAGSPAKLTATVTSGTPNYTYAWSNGTTNANITTDTNSIYVSPTANTNYTVTVTGSNGVSATATVAITVSAAPTATINYTGSPFCKSLATAQSVTLTGAAGGTYTVSPTTGLTINATTGAITPSTSTAGTYTVTYTIPAAGGCAAVTTTTSVTITTAPTATISYAGPFCNSNTTVQNVTLTGTTGGTYTVSPVTGLSINPTTGAITPNTSTAGTYTVTYTIAASGGCAAVSTTASVTITAAPTANLSYSSTVFCTTVTTAQAPTLTGTGAYTGGSYTVSPATGLTINPTTGAITPSTSTPNAYIITYSIPASGGCGIVTATANISISNAPSATITYPGSPYCSSLTSAQAVTLTGTSGGTYSVTPTTGLSINPATGAITPSASTAGTYTVTYSIAASGGCLAVTTNASVTITTAPTATINYPGSPFCNTLTTAQAVTLTGTSGGTYTVAPTTGLTINTTTGAITPSTSTPGAYTITYTIPAAGGCSAITPTANITVTAAPTATISYSGSPFCSSLSTAQNVTLTGTTGGTYSVAPSGLSINTTTGAITPSTSTAGNYVVTYSIGANGGCTAVSNNTNITITSAPTASISYAGAPFCSSTTTAQAVTLTGTTGGSYSSSAGLIINPTTGAITPNSSTVGTYTVSYTIPANGGCASISASSIINITAAPSATINYIGSPFCSSLNTPQSVTLTGTSGGSFSSTSGLTINTSTGAITPSTSNAGTYIVTYTIPASSGCAAVSTTANVIITTAPSATINFSGSPFCASITTPQAISLTGTSGGTYSSTPGLSINPTTGAITPSSSSAGNYIVTYSIAANGGCTGFSTTANATITTPPTATISYAGPFCKSIVTPQIVTLTGTTGGTFSSTAGLSINSSTGAITPNASTAGNHTVTYTIPASGGCAAVQVQTSVTILALPNLAISGVNVVCVGDPTTLTASGASSYLWSTGETTPSITVNPTLPSNSYSVTGSLAGCVISASINVTANTPPTIAITGATSICQGEFTTLTVSGANSYSWSNGALTNSITVNPQTSNSYSVIGTTNGCSMSASIDVTVLQKPLLTLTPTNPDCGVNNGAILASVTGTGSYTYNWSNGFTGNNNINLAPGSYLVTVSDGVCSSSDMATLIDPNNLVAGMYFTPRTTTFLDGNVNFTDASTGDATSWNWSFGDGSYGSGTNVQHYYPNVGTYLITLVITNSSGCTDTIQDSLVVKEIFTLYVPSGFTPDENAFNDGFQAYGIGVDPETFNMSIYDRWGGLMFYTDQWVDNKSFPAWNGTKFNKGGSTAIGVYSYIIHASDLYGKQHTKVGSISIVK